MAILAINRYFVGDPNIVGIVTDDDLAAITTAGYWALPETIASVETLQNGSFEWSLTDVALVYYATAQIGLFTFDATTNAFVAVPAGGDLVTSQEVQQSAFNHGTDTGIADAYAVALSPAVVAYTDGLLVSFTPTHNNATTTPTLNINGIGAKTITRGSGAVMADDIDTSTIADLIYSAAADEFTLLNPFQGWGGGGGVTETQVQNYAFNYGVDSGPDSSYVVTMSPPILSYFNGLTIGFTPLITNTSTTPNVTVDGLGTIDIRRSTPPGAPSFFNTCFPGDIVANSPCFIQYSAADNLFFIINPKFGFISPSSALQMVSNMIVESFSSAADAYVCNYTSNMGSSGGYTSSFPQLVFLKTQFANLTTTPTLEIDPGAGYGAQTIVKCTGAVAVGDILANKFYMLFFSGTQWILMNPSTGF